MLITFWDWRVMCITLWKLKFWLDTVILTRHKDISWVWMNHLGPMILHAKLMNILKFFHLYQNNMYQITMQIEIKTLKYFHILQIVLALNGNEKLFTHLNKVCLDALNVILNYFLKSFFFQHQSSIDPSEWRIKFDFMYRDLSYIREPSH